MNSFTFQDVNDEAPEFSSRSYDCEVAENSQRGATVTFVGEVTPLVSDGDAGANGTFTLSLVGQGADVFEVKRIL